jgi:hypothetical protein
MDPATFLQTQSTEYQHHLMQVKELTATLEHQLIIQSYKTIPKEYLPLTLKTSNPSLTDEFNSQYSQLFFQHLQKVVTSNQIKAELHKATLTSIIVQTEAHLSKSSLPQEQLRALYTQFKLDNNIKDRIAIPELQTKLQVTNEETPNKKTRRKRGQKRKSKAPHPQATKAARQSHFLSPRSQQTQAPP